MTGAERTDTEWTDTELSEATSLTGDSWASGHISDDRSTKDAISRFRIALAQSPALATLDTTTPTIDALQAAAGSAVVARLVAVEPVDVAQRAQVACEDGDGKPTPEQCAESITFALVRYHFELVRSTPVGRSADVSSELGASFSIDVLVGNTSTNRVDLDAVTEQARSTIVESAPAGMTFAMFLAARGGQIGLALWNSWAVADDSGMLHSLFVAPAESTGPAGDWTDELMTLDSFPAPG